MIWAEARKLLGSSTLMHLRPSRKLGLIQTVVLKVQIMDLEEIAVLVKARNIHEVLRTLPYPKR